MDRLFIHLKLLTDESLYKKKMNQIAFISKGW